MRTTTSDLPLRLATFEWLEEQSAIHGEVLPWSVLLAGFVHEGVRVPLVSMQGIFTPRAGRLPLTIRTAVGGPYADAFAANGLLLYKYRGTDPFHRDNEGLRQAMRERAPLVYLHGHREGRYHAIWPGFIVGDSPATLTFTVAADEMRARLPAADEVAYEDPSIRRGVTRPCGGGSTRPRSGSGCSGRTANGARSAGCATASSSTRRTSSPTANRRASPACPTVSPSASSTTPPSTTT